MTRPSPRVNSQRYKIQVDGLPDTVFSKVGPLGSDWHSSPACQRLLDPAKLRPKPMGSVGLRAGLTVYLRLRLPTIETLEEAMLVLEDIQAMVEEGDQ